MTMALNQGVFERLADEVGVHAANLLRSSDQQLRWQLGELVELLDDVGGRRVLLVVARHAVQAAGVGARLRAQFAGRDVVEFADFTPNPRSDQAAAAAQLAFDHGAELVVGIGGGSCLDVAKLAALAAPHPADRAMLTRGHGVDRARPLPLIAIPTTSGTGSEATHFAAIYVDGRKASIAHPRLRPSAVVLDVALHEAMPATLAAQSGLDALAQALESLWAVDSNATSARFAREALLLIHRHLRTSVQTGSPAARRGLLIGAHLAGQAINISKTTAAHALSYQLTQRFGLAHGHAVALTVGHLAAANAQVSAIDCQDPRGVPHVQARVASAASLLETTPANLPRVLYDVLGQLGLPATLAAAGVPEAALPALAAAIDPVRLGNNPRRFTTEGITALLQRAACAPD